MRYRHTYRTAPHSFVVEHEAGHEIFVLAGRDAVMKNDPDDL